MSIGRVPGATGIQPSIVTAKGDLIVATASGSVTNQAVGSNNQVLMADSAQADGVKWANEATATLTAKGDILTATAANTISRLAVGSNNQVLTVDSSTATGLKWATPAGGGKVLQVVSATTTTSTTISTTTMTDTTISATITPSSTSSKILVLVSAKVWSNGQNSTAANWNLVRGTTNILTRNNDGAQMWYASTSVNTVEYITNPTIIYLDSPNTTSATTYKIQGARGSLGIDVIFQRNSDASTITLLEIGA